MNTNKILWHTTKKARYWKYPNGVVEKEYFGKNQKEAHTRKCSVSNDEDGWYLIKTCLKQIGIKHMKYRCAINGRKYDCLGCLPKEHAKVIDIYFQGVPRYTR
jgi:hypothetical protein